MIQLNWWFFLCFDTSAARRGRRVLSEKNRTHERSARSQNVLLKNEHMLHVALCALC